MQEKYPGGISLTKPISPQPSVQTDVPEIMPQPYMQAQQAQQSQQYSSFIPVQPLVNGQQEIYPGQPMRNGQQELYPAQQSNYGQNTYRQVLPEGQTKFCKFCGTKIHMEAVVCTACGRQVEQLQQAYQQPYQQPQIIINNDTNVNSNNVGNNVFVGGGRMKNKWVAFLLCLLFGYFGVHKFYEGKVGMGLIYLFTVGLFGIGWLVDCVRYLFKPNPYFVK